ncbi:MAG: type II secretion system GspH family protein [Acidimicrobiia bacterium]|nr:type II secretion system GspH family protein [Acidimicrobiia bacterium]
MKRQFERLHAARVGEGEGGFTLIELLIVIVILGILAAVVVFSVSGITDTGDQAACTSSRSAIETGLEAAYAKSNPKAYPVDLAALQASGMVGELNGVTATWTVNAGPPQTISGLTVSTPTTTC